MARKHIHDQAQRGQGQGCRKGRCGCRLACRVEDAPWCCSLMAARTRKLGKKAALVAWIGLHGDGNAARHAGPSSVLRVRGSSAGQLGKLLSPKNTSKQMPRILEHVSIPSVLLLHCSLLQYLSCSNRLGELNATCAALIHVRTQMLLVEMSWNPASCLRRNVMI
jgi:hypothetical protein